MGSTTFREWRSSIVWMWLSSVQYEMDTSICFLTVAGTQLKEKKKRIFLYYTVNSVTSIY